MIHAPGEPNGLRCHASDVKQTEKKKKISVHAKPGHKCIRPYYVRLINTAASCVRVHEETGIFDRTVECMKNIPCFIFILHGYIIPVWKVSGESHFLSLSISQNKSETRKKKWRLGAVCRKILPLRRRWSNKFSSRNIEVRSVAAGAAIDRDSSISRRSAHTISGLRRAERFASSRRAASGGRKGIKYILRFPNGPRGLDARK